MRDFSVAFNAEGFPGYSSLVCPVGPVRCAGVQPREAPAKAVVLFPLQVITPYTLTPSTTPWVTPPRPSLPGPCAR